VTISGPRVVGMTNNNRMEQLRRFAS